VRLLTEAREWPEADRPRRAGVSSFGISGTNAHVILEAAPSAPSAPAAPSAEDDTADPTDGAAAGDASAATASGPLGWVLSAHTAQALRAQAERLTPLTAGQRPDPRDVAWSLATTREALDHRAVITGSTPADLTAGLAALSAAEPSNRVATGTVREGRTGFLFSGQGAQRVGMGRELYEAFPVFADAFDAVCARVDLELPLRDVVFGDDADALDRTVYAQPALFAVEVALFRLVESWGVTPDVLVGHSIGELAAAHCAGVLSLDDACRLVSARGRLMDALPSGGAMLAVEVAEDGLELPDGVDLAAVNGPTSITVSGDADAVGALEERLRSEGVRVKRLVVSHAFHSHLMEPMLDEFAAVAKSLTYHAPTIPVVTTAPGDMAGPDYWVGQIRQPVRFADAIASLDAGRTRFLELGPDGVLCAPAQQSAGEGVFVPSLRKDRDECESVTAALGRLWVAGVEVDWSALLPEGRPVELPTYAFQRERYWPEPAVDTTQAGAAGHRDEDEARFWEAVEHEDLAGLADTIGLPDTPEHLDSVLPALSAWRRSRREEARIESLRYRVTWTPLSGLPRASASTADPTGTWLLVGEHRPAVATALRAAGADVRETTGDTAGLRAAPRDVTGVLVAVPATEVVAGSVALLQRLDEAEIDAPVWMVTSGAVSVGRSDPLLHPEQAQAWGLGRVAALELPRRWGGLVDLPADPDARAARLLVSLLAGGSGEDQVAVRSSGAYGRRLARTTAAETPAAEPWTPTGTILVTGGAGALGGHVARWLAGRGAPHLVLLGRRGPDTPGTEALVAELAALGTATTVAACDVTDRHALAAVLDAIPENRPLTGVVHAAGAGQATPLADTDDAEIARVLDAKVAGAAHLDALTRERGLELDRFVVFSSIAATWGSGGQAVYAAANAYLDALVEQRRAHGHAGTSVAWGPWAGPGMAEVGGAEEHLHRHGLVALDPHLAVAALARAVDLGEDCVTVADVDWARFAPAFVSGRDSALLTGLPEAAAALAPAPAPGRPASGFRDSLLAAPGSRRHGMLLDLIRSRAAVCLGLPTTTAVEADRSFRDLGFDSLTAVELRDLLAAETGLALPATLVFDHPDPGSLAEHLTGALLEHAGPPAPETPAVPAPAATAADEPIAIVGMSARYPGGVRSVEQLWDLVATMGDGVAGFPADRGWPMGAVEGASARGGFVDTATEFDAGLFGISPREALAMDPQQRLLLEASWEAFESAGMNPRALRGRPVGVFAGASSSGYGGTGALDGAEGYLLAGTANSVISGRVAYTFGLEGPAVTVDTACSSSLVAMHLAAQALRSGECEMALAGGVTVMTTPGVFAEFDRQGGLAADGRCKAFADAADGTGWGEGVGVLVLEKLSDARRLGHEVLAVVRSSAVNQDGASNGLTAPNGPSQQRVIRQALTAAGLSPSDIDAVEGHGTGTRLGDPIEAQALLATYGQDREEPLYLGSVKSNIGHTQAASGVAGVIKMVLAMRHGVLPATLHVDEPSSQVDWSTGAVRLLTEPREWPEAERPRRAGVSSFGISGTNAHVILEQAEPTAQAALPAAAAGPLGWVVSAHTADGLRAQAERLVDVHAELDIAPQDVAWSLATGRAALGHRAVVLGDDREELLAGLRALAEDRAEPSVVRDEAAPGGSAFLFSGQGAQRVGMGRELYEAFPVFADAFDAVCARVDLELPLRDVVFGVDAELLARTVYTQPALFAVEVALFRLVESWGVTPDVLVGHSIGELAAAHCAGVLSLDDACALVSARGRLMDALPSGGAMLAVEASEDGLELPDGVDLAAVNGPTSVTVSGDADAIGALEERLRAEGVRVKRLVVSHAFHSRLMEPMQAEFAAVAGSLTYHAPAIPVVTTAPGDLATPDYWVDQIRRPVRFADAIASLGDIRAFLELGPDGVLCALTRQTLPDHPSVPLLRADRPEVGTALRALAALWASGAAVDWATVLPEGRRVTLPTYAFQRERYWPQAGPATGGPTADAADTRFWDAVERADMDQLADLLGSDGSRDVLAPALPVLSSWNRRRRGDSALASWRYRTTWRPVTGMPASANLTGRWLLVVPETPADDAATAPVDVVDVVDAVAAALAAAGAEPVRFAVPVDTDRATLAARLAAAGPVGGVVSLAARAQQPAPGSSVPTGLTLNLHLFQALGDAGIAARCWFLTSGAVRVGRADLPARPVQAQTWGLGLVAALEHPDRWGGLIDLPPVLDARGGTRLAAVLGGGTGEDQVAVRDSAAYGRRLVRAESTGSGSSWSPSRPGSVLVTGGTGALGTVVARRLADRGVPCLLLLSRRGTEAPGVSELVEELGARGTRVIVATGDTADRDALTAALAQLPPDLPLTGVVHAAGALDDGTLDTLTPERFEAVLAAKAGGVVALDDVTRSHDLDFFVAFSSLAGTLGSAGQGNYAAANAFVDAWMRGRRDRGLPGASIAWGPWAQDGMAADDRAVAGRLRRAGLSPMDPELAVTALEQTIAGDDTTPQPVVADIDWPLFATGLTEARPSPLLSELPEAATTARTPGGDSGPADGFRAELAAAPAGRRGHLLLDAVRTWAAAVLGHRSAEAVGTGQAFRDLGFDSLAAVELRNLIGARTGLTLPVSLVFDRPTPKDLARFLEQEMFGGEPSPDAAPAGPVTGPGDGAADEPVAIVGMSCRFPGSVATPEDLWGLLTDGVDAMTAFPSDRGWNPGDSRTASVPEGGFLRDVAGFDAGLFGISPREALAMDPQQRLLLEATWEAFESAGVDPRGVRGTAVGVFAGTNGQDYPQVVAASGEDVEGHVATGNAAAILSGRVSYAFGLEGPAVTVDTACSSSLVAMHLAAQALRSGECEMALAGGVTVMSTPTVFAEFERQGGLAADGRCKAFADAADGTGWGEGVGVLVLEKLSDAVARGHRVLAVVRGSAVNQDGASNGLTAP
ncbi:type I polyketide synthase, partial [Streptomyces sp. NPDC047130]|uniref:type I polyketide synthase n=1 Tax=Streptomyces sp. NPDC047130 TaxID=3155261 RepID=UPI0033FC0502